MIRLKIAFLSFVISLSGLSDFGWCSEKITFQTMDGFQISGEFFKPAAGKGALVLLHGLGSTKEEWKPFAHFLSSRGIGILIYDARGHGESTRKISGDTVNYTHFFGRGPNSDWGRMVPDLAQAVQYLKESQKIDPRNIAVGGASLGANVAIRYAALNKQIPFLILLSPGQDYAGITADDAILNYGNRQVFIAVSSGDKYSFQSVGQLQKIAPNRNLMTIHVESENAGHGVQMFRRENPEKPSSLEERLIKWIQYQR